MRNFYLTWNQHKFNNHSDSKIILEAESKSINNKIVNVFYKDKY